MSLSQGAKFRDFTLTSIRDIPEYESIGRYFVHGPTGCPVYHIVNDDEENLFAFVFKTPPQDSRGTAHIIEHSVLAGSRNFPIKDPFIALTRGSMNTFLNAMTYPDKTAYPASTTVKKDFFNLMEVYGDSVFFPLLRKETFHQEGRRYVINDEGLDVDGIVYNEMKGNYSSHDSIVGEWSFRSLFPDTCYRYDSGGEPEAIRDLTYEQFVDFHRRWYHPSNCRIFLYGDIPSEETLSFLDDRFLSHFSWAEIDATITQQPRWDKPIELSVTSPTGDSGGEDSAGSTITLNWLTAPVHDPLVVLSLEILTEILLGHSGSPLQKAIVESGIGEDLSPVSGLDTHTIELVFSVGVRGTTPEKREAFEKLVQKTLTDLVSDGIPADLVTGALRRVEFRNREIKGGGPFGLRLLGKAIRGWLHGQPPERTLEFEPWMQKVTELAESGAYFEGLIERLLVGNQHRSTVIVTPDSEHNQRSDEELAEWTKATLSRLTPDDRQRIAAETERFGEFQEEPDDAVALARVPSLELSDLPRRVESIQVAVPDPSVRLVEQYTNGIVYAEFAVDVEDIPEDVSDSLPLYCRAACNAGLPGMAYDEVARQLSIHTGGFTSFLESNSMLTPRSPESARKRSVVFFRLKSLESEFGNAVSLAMRLMLEADLSDTTRIKDLLFELRNDFKAQIIPAGHSFASLRAGSQMSPVLATEERWKGISQFFHLNSIADPGDIESVCESLARTRVEIMTRSRLSALVTTDASAAVDAVGVVKRALAVIPEGRSVSRTLNFSPSESRTSSTTFESLIIPATVGYMARVMPASSFGESGHASEVVAAQLLRAGYLWERIRMRGGAYGAFASADGGEGLFSFSSYRDPNVSATFEAFHGGLESLANIALPDDEVEKAIISVVGREVRPMSPSEKSMVAFRRYLYAIDDEMRQAKRDSLLAVSPESLKEAASRLLLAENSAASSALAGSQAIDEASKESPHFGENRTLLPM